MRCGFVVFVDKTEIFQVSNSADYKIVSNSSSTSQVLLVSACNVLDSRELCTKYFPCLPVHVLFPGVVGIPTAPEVPTPFDLLTNCDLVTVLPCQKRDRGLSIRNRN